MLSDEDISSKDLLSDINALFQAGLDTTLSSLSFALVLLSKDQSLQKQIYDELKSVEFDFERINDLHMLRAFVFESLRIGNVAPFGGVPHCCSKQQTLNVDGKIVIIPKGALVHNNSWFIHQHIGSDDKVHLEYWIDEKTKKFVKNEKFVMFGVGKRDCLGQQFAMNVLYAVIGRFICEYRLVAKDKNVKIKQQIGIVAHIKPKIGVYLAKRM